MEDDHTRRAVMRAPPNSEPAAAPGLLKPMPDQEIQAWMQAPRPTEDELIVRIRAALFHGYTPDMAVDEEEMLLNDWIEDLHGFPTWAIAEALKKWRRENPRRKPSSGAIRASARSEVRRLEDELRRRHPPEPEPERKPISPERAESILSEFGFSPNRMPKGTSDEM
ncbi:MAG: hypothetical protein ACQEUZ_06290 [Pseudomonadota bacterium]